MFNKKLLRQP
jgi:hypothetical protein